MGIFSSKLPIDMSSPKAQLVKDLIDSDTVVIFSKSYCPYCKLAKQVFDNITQKFTAIELDERDDCDEIQGILGEITGAKTVPRVFVKGQCLGGGSDVKALYEKGELQKYFS
ncbi:glutaredoxin-C4-like [Asbolus verrucosus]|uniref:Glutaredoxin-2, mitochondrial n=1 Tax=Asbolus verrucosus TaxID=1661398 RepID=A0A482VN20_ASBVE|nr:glutaredoxin-C4-like [Asbolus verrucosus]